VKTRALKNYDSSVGCEVYDIDLNSDAEILELGKIVGEQSIVFVDQQISTERLYKVMTQWGKPSRALIHNYILERKIEGRHWREVLLNLGFIAKEVDDMSDAVSMVSYQKDEKDRPKGIFSNADQCAFDDAPRMIGLQSVAHTANSQTQFLCTHDAFESFSSDTKSMIRELYCKHRWVDGVCAPGLNATQSLIIQYNMVPLDGMETRLYSENASGLPGIKWPSHSFDGFVGMSQAESERVLNMIKKAIYQDRYVYTQDWQDGQVVFMDQEITLHKRPTNVEDGSLRTMARVITYMDVLFPNKSLAQQVRHAGNIYTHEDFAKMVDQDRARKFLETQGGDYVDVNATVPVIGVDTTAA
jgi:Taurine catabolism dioxygenase TauD, TfdA family